MSSINTLENKVVKLGYKKQSPHSFKVKKEAQAKWHIVRPSVISIIVATIFLILSYRFEIICEKYFSNLFMSIGGGIVAGFIIYLLGNIRQKRIYELKEQSPEINMIKKEFTIILSLMIKILNLPKTILFFCYNAYYLPENMTTDDAIRELKNCLKTLQTIELEKINILKEFEQELYNDFVNFKKKDLYKLFNNMNNKKFVNELKIKKEYLIDIILKFQMELDGIKFYANEINHQII